MFLTTISLETARGRLLESAKGWLASKVSIPLNEVLGKIAYEDIPARECIPMFRRSTVDGYAVIASDTAAADESTPVFLNLIGKVEIGKSANISIKSGECIEVPTGGMLPEGADSVIMWEYTEEFGDSGIVAGQSVAFGENIVLAGEDAKAGDVLLKRGRCILPQDMGALAAAGEVLVSVYAPPRITIISTGDEIVPPEDLPAHGQVRDINSTVLAGLARKYGFKVTSVDILPDEEEVLLTAVASAMKTSDIVALSGGSSKGKKDLTLPVFKRVASPGVHTHGIAMQPGKPTILAYDENSHTILTGLPGHPVSAMMVFELLFGWLMREITGSPPPILIPARLSSNLATSPGRLTCTPCRLVPAESGYIAEPLFGQSGLITTLTHADGYFITGRDTEGRKSGDVVMVSLF